MLDRNLLTCLVVFAIIVNLAGLPFLAALARAVRVIILARAEADVLRARARGGDRDP